MAVPTDGSRTMVLHNAQPREEEVGSGSEVELERDGEGRIVGVLRLRATRRRSQRVAWTEDVVDNEGMGKKKSKSAFLFQSLALYFTYCSYRALMCSLLYLPQATTI